MKSRSAPTGAVILFWLLLHTSQLHSADQLVTLTDDFPTYQIGIGVEYQLAVNHAESWDTISFLK